MSDRFQECETSALSHCAIQDPRSLVSRSASVGEDSVGRCCRCRLSASVRSRMRGPQQPVRHAVLAFVHCGWDFASPFCIGYSGRMSQIDNEVRHCPKTASLGCEATPGAWTRVPSTRRSFASMAAIVSAWARRDTRSVAATCLMRGLDNLMPECGVAGTDVT